jgi:hypothetical protein
MKTVRTIFLVMICRVTLGYVLGYIAAGFETFMTILGRYGYKNTRINSCCSVLEQYSGKGFLQNLIITFKNFVKGISKLPGLYSQPNVKKILKTSIVILFTAESACILHSRNYRPRFIQIFNTIIHSVGITC